MISIIICSVNENFCKQVKENIAITIGVEYELLVWNNSVNSYSIGKVYNMLAKQAKFEILCFIHEDILFETKNWGQVLLDLLTEHGPIGMVGLAGSKYKSSNFSGWFTGIKEFDCINITHFDKGINKTDFQKPGNSAKPYEEVVCIDGVFIACKRYVWEKAKFNEHDLNGFHFYDIDFSLRSSFITEVVVSYDIKVVHITTGGDFGDAWIKFSFLWHRSHKNLLPKELPGYLYSYDKDLKIQKNWLDILKNQKISFLNRIKWIYYQKLYRNPRFFYSILKFFLYKPLKLKSVHQWIKE